MTGRGFRLINPSGEELRTQFPRTNLHVFFWNLVLGSWTFRKDGFCLGIWFLEFGSSIVSMVIIQKTCAIQIESPEILYPITLRRGLLWKQSAQQRPLSWQTHNWH